MKITLEPSNHPDTDYILQHKVTLEYPLDDLNVQEVVELFEFALLSYGFHPDSVAEALNEPDPDVSLDD
jgi:hypothetical protein